MNEIANHKSVKLLNL